MCFCFTLHILIYVLQISFQIFFWRDFTPLLFFSICWFISFIYFILVYFLYCGCIFFFLFIYLFILSRLILRECVYSFTLFCLFIFFLLSNDFIFHLAFWSNLHTLKLFVTYLSEMVLDLDNKFWRILLNHSSLSNH